MRAQRDQRYDTAQVRSGERQAPRHSPDGVWREVSIERGLRHSWRAWTLAGGAKAMALEHGLKRGKEETRRAAQVVGYLERLNFQLDPRLAALGNARRLLRQPMAARPPKSAPISV